MLDVKRLRILREVAAQGSFSAAADELYLSQSAVSQQIATLEKEVGMTLLDRTREGPKLTDPGRVLVSHAEAAMARLEEAERELAAIAGLEGGELRLASFPSASATSSPRPSRSSTRRYPKVRLGVVDAEPEESLPRLRAGEIDVALTFDYLSIPEPEERDLDRVLVLAEPMYLAIREDDELASQETVDLADLAERKWLCGSRPSTCGEAIFIACRNAGFEPLVSFESDDYNVMQGFISAGLGVTLLPDLALPTLRSDLVVRRIEPAAPERRVWATTRPAGARSPATDEMVRILSEVGEAFAARLHERLVPA